MAENKREDLTVKITADVDEAVAGFKRLQRELRETTKAVRELESAYKDAEKASKTSIMRIDADGNLSMIGADFEEPGE